MTDPVPWEELSAWEQINFTLMMNKRFEAGLSVEDAEEYYGNPDKVEQDFGEQATEGGPECPECFTPLYQDDIPYLKRTGKCPNCGAMLASE